METEIGDGEICSECGTPLPSEFAKFFHECGAKLGPTGIQNVDYKEAINHSTVITAGRDAITHIDGEMRDCKVCGGSGKKPYSLPGLQGDWHHQA